MQKYTIDTILRVRLSHIPGQLARFANAVAHEQGLIGEITTVRIGEHHIIRDITVATIDEAHTKRVIAAVQKMEGVEILRVVDRVFQCHRGGKLHSTSRVEVQQVSDLRYIYTPGVARVARAIQQDPTLAWEFTGISNSVGIFTNGSRVLGLGNIGPLASLPVMEGKAVLYDKFVGISATPLLIDTLDADEFIETVARLARTFGGIHLEDIRTPDCFYIEQALDARIDKPVMHDDQHGTATVALAALINACRITGKDLHCSCVGQIGLGAAGSAIAHLALAYGVGEVLVTDAYAVAARQRLESRGAHAVDLSTLLQEADIVIAATGQPGLIEPSMVRPGQVIFALSNPEPEIEPTEAMAAGAAFAGDGRSINNAMAFPGIFKGALEARSRSITVEMLVAAAEAIAMRAETGEVVPSPLNPGVHADVQKAVLAKARALGLANTVRL